MVQIAKQLFGIQLPPFKYEDDEKDLVTITSDTELREANSLAAKSGVLLRLFVSGTLIVFFLVHRFIFYIDKSLSASFIQPAPTAAPALAPAMSALLPSLLQSISSSPQRDQLVSVIQQLNSSLLLPSVTTPPAVPTISTSAVIPSSNITSTASITTSSVSDAPAGNFSLIYQCQV